MSQQPTDVLDPPTADETAAVAGAAVDQAFDVDPAHLGLEGVDSVTVSGTGPVADAMRQAAAAGELPGMPPKPKPLVRAGREIDHVKIALKGSEQFRARHPRVIDLADCLRMDAEVILRCTAIVTGEQVVAKPKDGDLEYVLTITLELQPTAGELLLAAGIVDDHEANAPA
jgi:hypothetical protein